MSWPKQIVRWFALPFGIFLVSEALNRAIHIYDIFPWLDVPMHFAGGAGMAFSFYLVIKYWQKRGNLGQMHPLVRILFITSLVTVVAVAWEWHEFLRDTFLHERTQLSQGDTMLDLFLGMIGGLVGSSLLARRWPK